MRLTKYEIKSIKEIFEKVFRDEVVDNINLIYNKSDELLEIYQNILTFIDRS